MQVTWIGAYKLTENNIKKHVPSATGVYRISIELKNKTLRIVYVGQSKDLKSRMTQYLNEDTDNKCLLNHLSNHICYFKFAEISHEDDRDAAEKALFEHFDHPECNDASGIPDVEPLQMNFN